MAIIPFGEWRPDLTDYQAETNRSTINAIPRGDGYGPLQLWQSYTTPLPGPCRGAFLGVDNFGIPVLFAGTETKLYLMNNATLAWIEVGDYPTAPLATQDNWTFVQFVNRVVACQRNVAPQVFTIGVSSVFIPLPGKAPGGPPPHAAYCAVVSAQLVLSGILSEPHKVQWSAKDDIEEWTLAVNGADFQEFPDGGAVMGVAGGEFGVVFQEAAIRRMTFLPGSDLIFQFDRMSEGDGLLAPYSIITSGPRVFFLGTDGFSMITGGAPPVPFAMQRFKRFFTADWDAAALRLMQGADEPNSSRVWFFYKSMGGAESSFDRAIVYDWMLDRAVYITGIIGEYAAIMSKPGITLDTLYQIGFTNIDTMQISFDDFSGSAGALLGIFGQNHAMGFCSGANMQAILTTPEQAFEQRYFISQIRPCTDAADVYSLVSHRARLEDASVTSPQSALNKVGFCPHRIDTRMARMTSVIPQGSNWSFAVGVEPLLVNTGKY